MICLLDEAALSDATAFVPDESLVAKLGRSNLRLIDAQGAALAHLASLLAGRNRVERGSSVGLYCCLEVRSQDPDLPPLWDASPEKQAEFFLSAVSPNRALRFMPVTQAFWSAAVVGAEGPVRVFANSKHAEQLARKQAELDLENGVCERALVLAMSPGGAEAKGMLFRMPE